MKKILILLLLFAKPLLATHYYIDEQNSDISFLIKHLDKENVRGRFEKFYGTMDFDDDFNTFKALEVKIDVDSINTGNSLRDDAMLNNGNYFTLDKDPLILFNMSRYKKIGAYNGTINGYLNVKNVRKLVRFSVRIKPRYQKKGKVKHPKVLDFYITGHITRQKFDMAKKASELLIANKIKIVGSFHAVELDED